MKQIFTTISIITLSAMIVSCTSSKRNSDNDLMRGGLKGSVKTITVNSVEYPDQQDEMNFNEAGFMTYHQTPWGEETLTLDEKNRIIKVNGEDPRVKYTYDDKHRLTMLGDSIPDSMGIAYYSAMEYNSDGYMIRSYWQDGCEGGETLYTYNDNGNCVAEVFNGLGGYDKKYTLNEQGDPIEIINEYEDYSSGEMVTEKTTIEYEYDNIGNWTKKTEDTNGTKVTTVRTITYY